MSGAAAAGRATLHGIRDGCQCSVDTVVSELTLLGELRAARDELDDRELALIDRARYAGATWSQIAEASGLSSRQAAEQRRQRLAAARARRDLADHTYAPRLVALRAAVTDLRRWIDADRRWDGRFTRAALVRATVVAAEPAPPGALHALAVHVRDDLAAVEPGRLPAPVRAAAATRAATMSMHH